MSVVALLRTTAALSRPTRTEAAPGQWVDSFVSVDSTYKCRVAPGSGADQQDGARRQASVTHAIYGAPGTMQRGDRVAVGSVIYEVKYVIQPSVAVYDKAMAEAIQLQAAS